MLEQSYYDKADEIIAIHGAKPSALIPIIQDIQSEYRYLPPELLVYVAKTDDTQTIIQKEEIEKMNRYGKAYTIMLIATAISAVPLFMWLGVWAFIPWGIIWAISLYFAFKVEKVKKDNDVQTYKEIVAFSEGKLLDDIQKQREIGKRPYQKILLVIGSAAVTFAVCVLIGFLMHFFLD